MFSGARVLRFLATFRSNLKYSEIKAVLGSLVCFQNFTFKLRRKKRSFSASLSVHLSFKLSIRGLPIDVTTCPQELTTHVAASHRL